MERRHKNILSKMQLRIVHDIDVDNVIDSLISHRIINDAAYEKLGKSASREEGNRMLLSYLKLGGPRAYSTFKEALKANYRWIVEEMEALEESEDSIDLPDAAVGHNIPHPHLPASPPLNVPRIQKMEQLRKGLEELNPGDYFALHGLQGFGKSTLASAALKDENFVEKFFQNEIYWIKFGQQQSLAANILVQLNMLFHRVRDLDHLAEPTTEDALKYSLKRHFSRHKNALLILDDVNRREIIDAFDFGCKTLVLTTDIDILKERRVNVIEMNDGFTAEESLTLFAKALGVTVAELPPQARQIHSECRGMPLMVGMFSSQFEEVKESLTQGKGRTDNWAYYLNALRKKKSAVLQESLAKLSAIFDMCIDKLKPEDRRRYNYLAIFPEDVNITTKTLSIFWGCESAEVNLEMVKFLKKSLVVRQWHPLYETFIYGVHDLVLSHLRSKLSSEDLADLHRSYVKKNFKVCQGNYSKLPVDNYIHSYIGYHMEKAGMKDEFAELYLDFGFIEAKVFYIGPGDLLIDLKKYRNNITGDSLELLAKVEDLEKFLIQQAPTLAEYRRRKCLDLVQVALKHPYPGFMRDTAEKLAHTRLEKLYFHHKHNTQSSNSFSEELHMQVRCVAFTRESQEILVGNDEGKVILWNCNNRHPSAFYGNNTGKAIRKIIVPNDGKYFVSISEDGKAKLFDLEENLDKLQGSYLKTLNPRAKQPDWKTMYDSRSNQDDSRLTFSIDNEKIIDVAISVDSKIIAVCTDHGVIAVWDSSGTLLVNPSCIAPGTGLSSVAFTTFNRLLHTINAETGALVISDAADGKYQTQYRLHSDKAKTLSLMSVPHYGNLLVVLLETKLLKVSWAVNGAVFSWPKTEPFAVLEDRTIVYTCAAVTRDGKYVVTADTGGSVNVHKLHENDQIIKTYKNLVTSLDTYWLEHDDRHIICGGNRDTLVPMVHRWKFNPSEKPVVQRLALFDATVNQGVRNVIAVATSNGTVQIIQNEEIIAETPPVDGKITSLSIFENANFIAYAANNGAVWLFDIKHNTPEEIMTLPTPVKFMTVLTINDENVIVCGERGEDLRIKRINEKGSYLVENTGAVIFCDVLKNIQRVLTVSDKVIKLWDPNTWKLQSKEESRMGSKISCCCLSSNQNYLAVANADGNLNIFKILQHNTSRVSSCDLFFDQKFNQGITACSFSHDEQLLAFGLTSGEINIINIQTTPDVITLKLHRRPVRRLYWGPVDIDEYILLSLTNELAWWNVSSLTNRIPRISYAPEIRHSMGELPISFNRGAAVSTTLDLGGPMRSSRSLDLGSVRQIDDEVPSADDVFDIEERQDPLSEALNEKKRGVPNGNNKKAAFLWTNKKPKYPEIPGLLGVIKLDGNVANKVQISKDFTNFITIDGEGSIYDMTVLGSSNNVRNSGAENGNGNHST